jgi:hypothetical protein
MLAASIKREVCRQRAAVLLKESGEPSEMIVVTVACDQGINFFYFDAKHFDVIERRIASVAKIEQHSALFAVAVRDRSAPPITSGLEGIATGPVADLFRL